MGYQDYLDRFDNKEELLEDIRETFTNSKEFVNLFLGYTISKSVEDKDKLFNEVVNSMANTLASAGRKNGR